MASEQGMSGIDVKAITSELATKLPLWIDKVYQYETRTMSIRLNGENKARYQMIIEAGRRAHLVKDLPEPPKNPPQFAMFLRKYLSGGKVLAIHQHGLERILIFDIGKGNLIYRLIIELFDEGNIILTDENYTIIKPLRHHRFKEREIIPHALYTLGATDPTASLENLSSAIRNDDRDLVRSLAIGCMLGGMYAEYICLKAGLDKSLPASQVNPETIFTAVQDLFYQVVQTPKPIIYEKHCEPIDIRDKNDVQYFSTFSEALEVFYPLTKAERKTADAKSKLTKEERILKYQKSAIRKFDEKIEKTEAVVAAIYENYAFVSQVISSLDHASKTHSWQDIEKITRQSNSPDARKIIAFYPEDAAVEIDTGKRIKIFVHEGIEQNAGRYYDVIKKFRKKKEGALKAMKTAPPKKKEVRREFIFMKKLWYHRFRWFVTSDGVVVLGGRDASQNEELVKKYMGGQDLFVHADVHGASVVIVKGKTVHMDEVAQFAASYSGAWRSGHFSADVYSALPSQVSKTPESGEFISRGSFIVRGERTYYRNIPLAIGIGLMLDPHAAVIGGPLSAIKGKTKTFVELKPGQFEPNDVAKKVLRILKQNVSEEEEKVLKGILNTTYVAAFVPPGGSDIVGHHES
ncbi:MAG: NFACT family protein [Methanoregula sp.]|jgi:predicted ribosome quality control (RQC) complex YloA/Tae2 family protein|nr:NFACT family protein [Methanoregula sp.]